jgi:hypothetical protein
VGSVLITSGAGLPGLSLPADSRASGVNFAMKRSFTAGVQALTDNMPGEDSAGGPRKSLSEMRQTFERQGTGRLSQRHHSIHQKRVPVPGDTSHSSQAYEDVLPANAL